MLVWAQQETAGGRAVMMDGLSEAQWTRRLKLQTEGHTEADVSCLLQDKVRVTERWGVERH